MVGACPSVCLRRQGSKRVKGGEAWPKENRKLRSSISISTRDEGAKVVRRDGVRMENNDSMPDICRRGRDKINSPLNPLWKKSHRLPGIKMIIFYLYIAHLNSYLNSFQKNFHSNSSFTSFFFLLVNTTSSKETRRFPIKQLVYILRIAIESGNTRS